MEQWAKIIRVDNGYIVEYPFWCESINEVRVVRDVFEDANEELGDRDSLQAALYAVMGQVGCTDSRYDKKRVMVIIKPGDKYVGKEDD